MRSIRVLRRWKTLCLWVAMGPAIWFGIGGVQMWLRGGADRIEVSMDVTRATQPLDQEGFVDYVAAVNLAYRGELTPDNNAAVWLFRAFGPRQLDIQGLDKYYSWLGIEPLPDDGRYFVSLESVAERHAPPASESSAGTEVDPVEVIYVQHDQAISGPWSPDQCPWIEEWLEANRRPLDHTIVASRQDQFFFPLVFGGGPRRDWVLGYLPPMESAHRKVFSLMAARAMRRMASGETVGAITDALVALRIGRLIGQSMHSSVIMAGEGMESAACQLLHRILSSGEVNQDQIASIRESILQLPPRQPH